VQIKEYWILRAVSDPLLRYNEVELWERLDVLVKIETYFDDDFWCARGIGEDIFTQGKTLDELYQNIKEAVSAHFGELDEPLTILS